MFPNASCLGSQKISDFADGRGVFPAYIRMPRKGRFCWLTGLSRTALYDLISGPKPQVKSVSLRQGTANRGARLVEVQSLLDWIRSHDVDEVVGVADAPAVEPGKFKTPAKGGMGGAARRR